MLDDARLRQLQAVWAAHEGLPSELVGAELQGSEGKLAITRPVPMEGRIDQLYRTERGRYLIVDTKKRYRPRVKAEDVVQLSCYRFMLNYAPMMCRCVGRLEPFGYVRCEGSGRVAYLKVQLLSDEVVVRLYRRWLYLYENGGEGAVFRPTVENCQKCVGRLVCDRAVVS